MNITAINAGVFNRNNAAQRSSASFKSLSAVSIEKATQAVWTDALKSNHSVGLKALEEFLSVYPDLISPAAVRCRHLTEETGIYGEKRIKLEAQEVLRKQFLTDASSLETIEERFAAVSEFVKREKIADSLEQTVLLIAMLKNKAIDAMPVCLSISHQRGPVHGRTRINSIHSFVLIGFDKGAQSTKPATWGKDAVVIDTVNKLVMPAKEGLDAIYQSLNIRSFEKTDLL